MAKGSKSGFFFKDWVEFYGRARLAEELGVTTAACHKWAQGKTLPEVRHMRVIKKLSGGRVDYHHIIDGTAIEAAGLGEA